jgi:hypothetical protein
MTMTAITQAVPTIREGERIAPAADSRELMRRLAEHAYPGVTGLATPLTPSSALVQCRVINDPLRQWVDIETEEMLDYAKARPEVFEIRTLYEMPVDDLVRAPNFTVRAALDVVDQARRDRKAAALKLRTALAILEEMP